MTTVTAEARHLSKLDADTLAGLYRAGDIDLPALLAIDRADVAAGKARARQAAERAAWLDAAHAEYLRASEACNGHLLRAGAAVADELALWRGSEQWARGQASEELNGWWDDHGRLSLAAYRRQQAMQARAYRDERDLAAMPERAAPSARDLAERAAAAPRQAPRQAGSIARYITALGSLQRQAEATARVLARVNGGIQS